MVCSGGLRPRPLLRLAMPPPHQKHYWGRLLQYACDGRSYFVCACSSIDRMCCARRARIIRTSGRKMHGATHTIRKQTIERPSRCTPRTPPSHNFGRLGGQQRRIPLLARSRHPARKSASAARRRPGRGGRTTTLSNPDRPARRCLDFFGESRPIQPRLTHESQYPTRTNPQTKQAPRLDRSRSACGVVIGYAASVQSAQQQISPSELKP